MSKPVFSWPIRVYFQDTDAGGVVYHASYLNFMERARTEWLRSFGYSNAGMMKDLGRMFVVRSLLLNYLAPAELDDVLQATVEIIALGRSQITLRQKILRDDTNLSVGEVKLVCVLADNFKPVRVPEILRQQWS